MRHKKWEDVCGFIDAFAARVRDFFVVDKRCGKSWDPGQAVCAEAYGPKWSSDPTFIEWNGKDDDEPPEPYYYECAKRMAEGYTPEWIETIPRNKRK